MTDFNPLSDEESYVLVSRGTEPPFSGEYDDFYKEGTYLCRRCNNPLFPSKAKFDAQCGWPAFDEHFPDAVRWLPDPDGSRTEIRCTNCDGHLGHVFRGERMTPSDTRHCVNSLSIRFVSKGSPLPPVIRR